MQNSHNAETPDFSAYSRDELLVVIRELRHENALLRSDSTPERSELIAQKMSFRQEYAEKILDALPDMLTVVTDDGVTIAVVSSEDTNHSGILREDIGGVPVKVFLPDHVCAHVMESIDQAIMYGKSDNLSHLMYVDGKPHYFENRTVRIDHDCNLCLCRDITAEMLAKLQLESLSYAVNLVNENIFSLNSDGEFLFANKQFLKDHKQKNILGKSAVGVLFSCQTQNEWEELKQKVERNSGEVNYIQEVNGADGAHISYEVMVRSVRNINNDEEFWFFARNITTRLEQDLKIKELNALMNAILSNIPISLFVKGATDSRYIYWNKALEERTGISEVQAVGHTNEELFGSKSDALLHFNDDDFEVIKNNCRTESIEEVLNIRGETRILKSIKVPIERVDKQPLIIGVSLDITDIKMVEHQLIIAKQEADKSNQLKSAFLANMSHEIRTPLNAIVGFAKLILTEEDVESKQEFADIIDRNADMLLQLINDILDLSKIEAGTLDFTFKDVNLNELCADMLEIHRLRVSDGVSIVYEGPDEEVVIEGDRNRLAQVFTNLLTNAVKFTHQGEICFGYSIKGDSVEAFVRDTGMGISAEKLPTIFDRFIKLNNFVAGTGLGLSITKTIIERLGGVISVTSEEGKGSEFRFTIPYRCGTTAPAQELPISEISMMRTIDSSPSKSILVVEDNDSNYLLVDKVLGSRYSHYQARNGVEAIEMFRQHSPSLILMDIKMPVMDGLEATRQIRMLSTEVPIIALSAFAYDRDKDVAIEAGCNHFMTKPLSFDVLISLIERYLDVK